MLLISCSVAAQQRIRAFDFTTWIVQALFFLNLKFQASSHLISVSTAWFGSDLVGNLEDMFSHDVAHLLQAVGASVRIFDLMDRVPKVPNEGGDIYHQMDGSKSVSITLTHICNILQFFSL